MSRTISVNGTICKTIKEAAEMTGTTREKLAARLRYTDRCIINGFKVIDMYWAEGLPKLAEGLRTESRGQLIRYPLGERPLDHGLLNTRR